MKHTVNAQSSRQSDTLDILTGNGKCRRSQETQFSMAFEGLVDHD